MKRLFFIVLLIGPLLFTSCGRDAGPESIPDPEMSRTESQSEPFPAAGAEDAQMRAVWISYNELSMGSDRSTEQDFRQKAADMLDYAASLRLNTVIVHARAFSDAFYRSDLFPYSKYLTGIQGEDPGYDPLEIMVEEAHARQIKIHAWINPYRVSYDTDFTKLSEKNPARRWHEEGREQEDRLIVCGEGIFYNPASSEAQKLIIDGAREIAERYAVDGIHYDDYFYPSTDPSIDQTSYQAYLDAGGKYSLEDWRRENVNNFVSGLYSAIKSAAPSVAIGISPSANLKYNYNKMYADTALWAGTSGYCDYILPQVYYGFENQTLPFEQAVQDWVSLCTGGPVQLCFGLAFYKCGSVDEFASSSLEADSPRYEWQRSSDMIVRQLRYLESFPECAGYAFYSYASLREPPNDLAAQELKTYQDQFVHREGEEQDGTPDYTTG